MVGVPASGASCSRGPPLTGGPSTRRGASARSARRGTRARTPRGTSCGSGSSAARSSRASSTGAASTRASRSGTSAPCRSWRTSRRRWGSGQLTRKNWAVNSRAIRSWSSIGPVADCGSIDRSRATVCSRPMSTPIRAAAIRASSSSADTPGGGHGVCSSQIRRIRNVGSSASRWESAVEPVRGNPTPSNSMVTSCSSISGMTRVPVLDLQPVDQRPDERSVERRLTEVVEASLGLRRPDQHFQALAPGVAPELAEAGLRLRLVHDVVDTRGDDARALGRGHDRSSWSPGIERSIIPLADSPSQV